MATRIQTFKSIPVERLSGVERMPVAIQREARRKWEPWDLEMATVGADGRCNLWRYITPSGSAVYSRVYSFEGCEDILLFFQSGRVQSTAPTCTVALCVSMFGGADFWGNAVDVTPSGAGLNALTCSNSAAQYLTVSTVDKTTASNVHRRGWTPNFWGFYLSPSAAGVPITAWAVGR